MNGFAQGGRALSLVPEKVGTVYRGGQGQWSWALHRITGVAVFLFLLAHIVDTALVGFGPDLYNRVVHVYHNPIIRLMEIALAMMVLFHALNGLRIMAIDFIPGAAKRHKELFGVVVGLYLILATPALYFMGRGFFRSL
jgi:succinate dehydrogenase / fumarate reductase cytochrome b subunit